MISDCVVVWVKRSLIRKIIYVPDDLVKQVNTVKSVDESFMKYDNENCFCFTGFERWLQKYMKKIPKNFTDNYIFEFHVGNVTIRHL